MKHEGRKTQNLIADFGSNFGNYKYFENTHGQEKMLPEGKVASASEFMQDSFIFYHMKALADFKNRSQLKLADLRKQPDRELESAVLSEVNHGYE